MKERISWNHPETRRTVFYTKNRFKTKNCVMTRKRRNPHSCYAMHHLHGNVAADALKAEADERQATRLGAGASTCLNHASVHEAGRAWMPPCACRCPYWKDRRVRRCALTHFGRFVIQLVSLLASGLRCGVSRSRWGASGRNPYRTERCTTRMPGRIAVAGDEPNLVAGVRVSG